MRKNQNLYILVIFLSGLKQKSEEVAEGEEQNDAVAYFFFFPLVTEG